jgi:hypothetical protein
MSVFPKLENNVRLQNYLEENLASLISTADTRSKKGKTFDLFAICSCLYLHMILYITLGEEVMPHIY